MNMPGDRYVFIKMAAVFCAPCTAEQAAGVMRRAIEPLVSIGLSFDDPNDRDVFDRAKPYPLDWSKRPVFLSGPGTSYAALVDHYWRPDAAYHYLVVSLDQDFPSKELAGEWTSLTKWSELVVDALVPHFAFGWATPGDAATTPIDYESLQPTAIPAVIVPWTFFGKQCLRQSIREQLALLPAHQSRPLGDGWLIEAVEVPGTPPREKFAEELRSIGRTKYVDPLLE